jgi:hypothetical protein
MSETSLHFDQVCDNPNAPDHAGVPASVASDGSHCEENGSP